MEHILDDSPSNIKFLEENIFPNIYRGEVILFLGAGASVTNKKYLSIDIIKYYQDKLGIDLDTKDLIEFMDLLSARPDFDRNEFDSYILKLLDNLKISEVHKKIANIRWKEIITTNYDLLIEKVFEEESGRNGGLKLKLVKNRDAYHGHIEANEIKYVKLNGCASDKSRYPFVITTSDFDQNRKYYNTVFSSLSSLSLNIKFLSIGFSYSDGLSERLIKKFDSNGYRNKKTMYSIDPFVNMDRLPYYKENGICIIKLEPVTFFKHYLNWESEKAGIVIKRKHIEFTNTSKQTLIIPKTLQLRLGESIIQLADTNTIESVLQKEYYRGSQPTYDVVRRNYDVIKQNEIRDAGEKILSILRNEDKKQIIPILFFTGHFGSGKSTFTYRVIFNLLHKQSDLLAFEIKRPDELNVKDLGELCRISECKKFIFLCNELEIDSAFKELMTFRNLLSSEQYSEYNFIFLSSIRENMLTTHLKKNSFSNVSQHAVNLKFNKDEATDFIEKLRVVGLCNYRDTLEKNQIITRLTREFDGDAFISLLIILSNEQNYLDGIILNAVNQLTPKAKEAFIYTSLVYQYKILIPAALLMLVLSNDWNEFASDVLQADGIGLLIQEIVNSPGTSKPDLYFKTRHSVLSMEVVKKFLSTEDRIFEKLRKVIIHLSDSDYYATFFVNTMKAFSENEALSDPKIDELYDIAANKLDTDHFNLHYAINLQRRKTEQSFKKALSRLIYSKTHEDFEERRRNHYIIHRRAVINFDLAKLYLNRSDKSVSFYHCISEAKELFDIKLTEDQFSSYSYYDYLRFQMWCLDKLEMSTEDLLRQHIKIQNLFEKAEEYLTEGFEDIIRLKGLYLNSIQNTEFGEGKSLEDYVNELYANEETRPYALIIKYYSELNLQQVNQNKLMELISEMEMYSATHEVARTLFNYYGNNLQLTVNIQKFFQLIHHDEVLKKEEKFKYNYYSYIAEAYGRNFSNIKSHLEVLRTFGYLSPEMYQSWLDSESGKLRTFEGRIIKNQYGKFLIRIEDLGQNFLLIKNSNRLIKVDDSCQVNLHFFLKGIKAEII